MRRPTTLPWRPAAMALTCAAVLAACQDDGVSPNASGCEELRQSETEIAAAIAGGATHVRASLVSRVGVAVTSEESVGLAGLELYAGNRCYVLLTPSTILLRNAEGDAGAVIAEAAVDLPQITHVALLGATANGTRPGRAQKIELTQPVTLEGSTRHELFLALDPGSGAELNARFLAAGQGAPSATMVFAYEPGRGGSMKGANGFTIDLPDGAAAKPMVVGLTLYDLGGLGPSLDISPAMALERAARIGFRLDKTRLPEEFGYGDYGARSGGTDALFSESQGVAALQVARLGWTGLHSTRDFVETETGRRFALRRPRRPRVKVR